MQNFQDQLKKIKNALKDQPRGLTILEISDEINVNRNSVAKYLEVLRINGQVEMKKVGTAKVFFLSKRIPSQSLMNYSLDCILVVNNKGKIIQVNDQFIKQCPSHSKKTRVIGKHIDDLKLPLFEQTELSSLINKALNGKPLETEVSFKIDDNRYYFNTKLIPSTFEDGTIGATIFLDNNTKRKIAEEKLRESEEKFRQITENMNDVIWLRSKDNKKMLYVSPSYEELWGKSCQSLYDDPNSFIDSVHTDDREMVITAFENYNKNGNFDIEYRIISPNGEIRWIHARSYKIKNNQGETIRHAGVATDITKRKKAELSLVKQIKFENLLRELSSLFIEKISFDKNINQNIDYGLAKIGELLGVDRVYIFQFNWNRNEMTNTYEWCAENITPQIQNLKDLPTDVFPEWMRHLKLFDNIKIDSVSTLGDTWKKEKEILEPQDIKSLAVVPISYGNSLLGFVGCDVVKKDRTWTDDEIHRLRVFGDILGSVLYMRKKEKELFEREEKFEKLFHASPDISLIVDNHGIIQDINDSFVRKFKLNREEIIGKSFNELEQLSEKTKRIISEKFKQRMNGERIDPYEIAFKTKDNRMLYIEINSETLQINSHITGEIVIGRDITNRKQMIEDVSKREKELRMITENTDDAIIMMDNHDNVKFWNTAAEKIFGYKKSEAIGKKVHDLLTPDKYNEKASKGLQRFMQSGIGPVIGKTVKMNAQTKQGKIIPVELTVNSYTLDDKLHAVAIIRKKEKKK